MRTDAEILRAQHLIYAALESLERDPDREAKIAMAAFFDTLSWVLGKGARFQGVIQRLESTQVDRQGVIATGGLNP